jgi:ABC-type amino acid transport system permease subunit
VVLLLKDTSLLSVIAVTELTMQAKVLTERTAAAYQAFLVAAVLYLLLVSLSEIAFRTAHRAVRWR